MLLYQKLGDRVLGINKAKELYLGTVMKGGGSPAERWVLNPQSWLALRG